jgi:hypothetical protein
MTTLRPSLNPNENDRQGSDREARLSQIQRDAKIQAASSNAISRPSTNGNLDPTLNTDSYYGLPLLKSPPWTWEVPIYFFAGGAAGASAIISLVARWSNSDPRLVSDARWIAAIGGAVSPALLVSDLGYPRRFLNMLRVFKLQSPMSVGSWTLVAFSSSAAASAFFHSAQRRPRGLLRLFSSASEMAAAISGAVLATYTGVLIGATAVPVWHEHVSTLPVHFAMSGLASATSLLELRGHDSPALNTLGIAACTAETAIGARIEADKRRVNDPLKRGLSGWLTRTGGLLSGPLPLALRLIAAFSNGEQNRKLRRAAAVSSIAGSLITRVAWISAGKVSAQDPTLELHGYDSSAGKEIAQETPRQISAPSASKFLGAGRSATAET